MRIPRKYRKNKARLLKYLVENKQDIIEAKKSQVKNADALSIAYMVGKAKVDTKKAAKEVSDKFVDVRAIINTTNLLDSHKDVHIEGLWDEDLESNNRIKHIQEHKSREFDKIIASGEDLDVFVKEYDWSDLGVGYKGKTQALVFDSRVRKSRNKFMYKQYKKGFVDNHSVGMVYKEIVLCVDSEDYEEEYENFIKYSKFIANKDAIGNYFFAVLKAGVVEGSAVPDGSNFVTPTLPPPTSKRKAKKTKTKNKTTALEKWLSS